MNPPNVNLQSRVPWVIAVIGSAAITGAAGLGGTYIDHERRPPIVQITPPAAGSSVAAEYMLWSPSGLNPRAKQVIILKLDTRSGNAWLLHTNANWTQPNWVQIKEPSST